MSDLVQALPFAVLRLSPEGLIRAANPAAEEALGASERSLCGTALRERLSPDLTADVARAATGARLRHSALALAAPLSPPAACDVTLTPHEGEVLLCWLPPGARSGGEGQSEGAARAAIGMAEMLAHEIKNPLAGIIGAAQLLEMSASAEDRELTGLIQEESRRILRLLAQVEEFGDTRPPELARVNIHDVLDRARRTALLGAAAGMSIVEDYDPSLPETLGDADQLMQVLLNLIRNAAEATGSGGQIRLRTSYDPAPRRGAVPLPLRVEVVDNGPGIPPEIAPHVFDPFVTGRENGTGLGLALVAKIIAAHGGLVTADSQPGHTVLRLALPLVPREAR